MKFKKSSRLLRRSEYQKLHRVSKTVAGNYVVLDYSETGSSSPKLGITVTKKYGKAHERNRFKRIVREAFRHSMPDLQSNLVINVRPRAIAKEATFTMVLDEFVKLLPLEKSESGISQDNQSRPSQR